METVTSVGAERPGLDPEGALRFLADASTVLAGSLDYEATVKKVAELVVPRIADWCGIDVVEEDGGTRQLTSGLEDPRLEAFLLELRARYRLREDQTQGTAAALEEGRSILVRDAGGEAMVALTDEERELYDQLAVQSYMIVPLIARGRILGALTLLSRQAARRFGPLDLAFAEHLARRFALAIDNARLYDRAESSLALLDTLFATAPIGLGFLETELRYVAVNAALAELNGGPVAEHLGRTVAQVVPDLEPELASVFRRVLETGQPQTNLEIEGVTPRDPGEPHLFNASCYPVRDSTGAVLGLGIVITDITERRRAEAELAAALQRARFLSEAGTLLDASLDYETTLESLAGLAVVQMADWCGVDVVDADGTIRNVAVAHIDPAKVRWAREMQQRYPTDPASPTGVPNVVRTGQSELYPQIPDEMLVAGAVDDEHLELLRQLDIRSAMVVPIVARGRTLGAISLVGGNERRPYDQDDLALAEELARRAALAVDNARLYTELSGIADTLQAELLPKEIPDIPGIDVAVRYRAAGELNRVGGDFYDVFPRGPNEWAVVIGDVSGKGAAAAAITALARYTLRTAAGSAQTPSEALRTLNEALLERREDQEFCSAVLAFLRLEPGGVAATVSLGGHPLAYVRRADGKLETCGSPGLLLGFAHDPPLTDDRAVLGPGDTLLLYTDGVTDAARDGDRFGDTRLESLASALALDSRAGEIAEAI